MTMSSKTIQAFARAINDHDVEAIADLMTDDHTFIDSQNNAVTGKAAMKAGWKGYFELFPDYKIEVTDIIESESIIAAFGFADGTFGNINNLNKNNHFHIPAAWKAIVENEKIKLWQVYADAKIPFDIIEKNK